MAEPSTRAVAGTISRGEAAVGLHHQHRLTAASGTQRVFEIIKVGADDRAQIGIDDGRAGALEFANLRQHVERDAERQMREFGFGDGLDQSFVHRVGIGV